jgi:hypothetical protein
VYGILISLSTSSSLLYGETIDEERVFIIISL